MAEVANPREEHRRASLLGRRDHFGVAHRAARLSEGRDTCLEADLDRVRERIKSIGAADRANERLGPVEGQRLGNRLAGGDDPARLARAEADLHAVFH